MRVSERQAIESVEERELEQPTSMHPAAYSWVWCNMNTLSVTQACPTILCISLVAERISAGHWIAECGRKIRCMYVRHAFEMQLIVGKDRSSFW